MCQTDIVHNVYQKLVECFLTNKIDLSIIRITDNPKTQYRSYTIKKIRRKKNFILLQKIMNKKIIMTLLVIMGALYAIGNITQSLQLIFPNVSQSFWSGFSLIQFAGPGNNFVGSTFRLSTKSVSPVTITFGTAEKTCTKQLRGLYFNSQRGKRLRPLDQDTLNSLQRQNSLYDSLEITGWLFTTCTWWGNTIDTYSIFWAITYTRSGQTSQLVAGTKLDFQNNKITTWLAKSFQYFDNKIPIGYIYDSIGRIGFVGGIVSWQANLINFINNSWGTINSGFIYSWTSIISSHPTEWTITILSGNAMQTLRNMIIQGSIWLSKTITETERLSLLGNFQNNTVIYNASDINSSTLINFTKQKAQELCKGKERYTNTTLGISTGNIVCVQNQNLIINLNEETTYQNKTILVKSGNIVLSWGMTKDSPSLDLFIDKWLLVLPQDWFSSQGFDEQGFPVNTDAASSWLYLKGNLIVNGLIAPSEGTEKFTHKLHIQGKVTMLNAPLTPTEGKILQINNLLWTNTYKEIINLQNIFTRECSPNGVGTDNTLCAWSGAISRTPLVITNGNYRSNILQ